MYKGDFRIIVQQADDVKILDYILIVGDERFADAERKNPGTDWVVKLCLNNYSLEDIFTVSGTQAVLNAGLCWIEGGSWEDARASQRSPLKS